MMGLDVALAIVILIGAIRGWVRGFVSQTVKIAGLIACVYVAAPLRDQITPHVGPYVASIPAELVDRMLWWGCAAVSYVVMVGVTSLLIKMTRRPEIPGIPDSSGRNDQFAGFLLGAAKGTLAAACITAGITAAIKNYALDLAKTVPWADEQVKTSMAIKWNAEYQPVPKVWSSGPVQHFVNHVRTMGLQTPDKGADKPGADSAAQQPPVQTASRSSGVRDGYRPENSAIAAPPLPEPPAAATTPRTQAPVDPQIEAARAALKSDPKGPN
jgi:uncharacterized membrane protein required for colicin V production